ncbi:MAG: cyclic nucleotide-binding domain-containing protein [Treponema sp.]|nr:cyclic nucleotide-binding domain-containing protein [Treponema sp.]
MLQLSFVNYRKGSYILVEGKPDSSRFFIIQRGQAQCIREIDFATAPKSNILGPGDFVGVIPCMSNHNQIESVVALTDLVAISVRRDQYSELIEKNTPVAMKIIRVFAARMREMNETLLKMALQKESNNTETQLYNVAVYYDKVREIDAATYAYYHYLKTHPTGKQAETAKKRFIILQERSKAVHLEPKDDMIREYPQGAMIFAESQSGQDMYIIQEGQVKITKIIDTKEVVLAVLKKGDFFGEMALLENLPRSASAIAHEKCKLMVINRKNFDQLVSTQSQMISRLTTTLAERLWSMYRQVTNTRLTDPIGKLYDMLALEIEKQRLPLSEASPTSLQLDISPQELANMCTIPPEEQYSILDIFIKEQRVKVIKNKLFVPNCLEIIKHAAYYRKQKATKK